MAAKVVEVLRAAYADEIETVANYLALSHALDGVHAEEVKENLADDVTEELGHAQSLAARLKEVGDLPPGSLDLDFKQKMLQPPADTTDVRTVVEGVLDAEEQAIDRYRTLINVSREEDDPVTEDLAIQILKDEEKHRTLFEGYLKELSGTAATRERQIAH